MKKIPFIAIGLCLLSGSTTSAIDPENYEVFISHQKKSKVDGLQLAFTDEGEGPAVLLVHGIPTASWLYVHVINGLLSKGYHVIAPDVPGFGQSDKPDSMPFCQYELQAKRLLTLMDHLGVDKWTHVCPRHWRAMDLGTDAVGYGQNRKAANP